MKNTKQQEMWIEEGRKAASEGKPDTACPKEYDFHFEARAAWLIGWERGGGNIKTGAIHKPKEQL